MKNAHLPQSTLFSSFAAKRVFVAACDFAKGGMVAALLAGTVLVAPSIGVAQQAAQGADQLVNVVAQQQVRIADLERLVQQLTGQVEEAQFQNRQLRQRLDQLMKDVDFRFQQLSGGAAGDAGGQVAGSPNGAGTPATAGGQPAGETPQGVLGYLPEGSGSSVAPETSQPVAMGQGEASAGAVASPLPPGTPEEQYNYSFGLLRKNDFTGAEAAFKAFLQQHKDHALAGNAQYWLGETYYARGDFPQALVAFYDGYRNYPKSSKAPDNLLKLGITAGQLSKPQQACAALSKLAVEYPSASEMLKRRAQIERQRQGC